MGLAKRLKFYCRPGVTQRTSIRLNSLLLDLIAKGVRVDIYVATPEDQVWNGLPVHGPSGLEYSLISKYHLPWNIRGAAKAR